MLHLINYFKRLDHKWVNPKQRVLSLVAWRQQLLLETADRDDSKSLHVQWLNTYLVSVQEDPFANNKQVLHSGQLKSCMSGSPITPPKSLYLLQQQQRWHGLFPAP